MSKAKFLYLIILSSVFVNLNISAASMGGAGGEDALSDKAKPVLKIVRTSNGLPFNVQILPGDRRVDYDLMRTLHRNFKDGANVIVDLRGLRDRFSDQSIQYFTLNCISNFMDEAIKSDTLEEVLAPNFKIKDSLSEDMECATRLFRFTMPAGMVMPAYFPTDEEYVSTVRALFEPGKKLHQYVNFFQRFIKRAS